MIRSLLTASVLALFGTAAFTQSERPLIDWERTQWNPESQAACGVFLTKFGTMVSLQKQTNEIFQILWRGYALNELSAMTDPATNKRAWAAPVELLDETGKTLFLDCGLLVNQALKDGLIPESIQESASEKANETLRNNS